MVQVPPASVSTSDVEPAPPTATQSVAVLHDTLSRTLKASVVLGLGTTDHSVPFQLSIRVLLSPNVVQESPTAVHDVVETHEIPTRKLLVADVGLGLGTIVHPPPVADSISGWSSPLASRCSPTAVQVFGTGQDTVSSVLVRFGAVFGVGVTDQVPEAAPAGVAAERATRGATMARITNRRRIPVTVIVARLIVGWRACAISPLSFRDLFRQSSRAPQEQSKQTGRSGKWGYPQQTPLAICSELVSDIDHK
jgi:hypothetical protein